MSRILCLTAAALGIACCAPSRQGAATPDGPAWLEARVAEAEASDRGYPRLEDVPAYVRDTTSLEAWRRGVDEMSARRHEVLNDPALIDPDAEAESASGAPASPADAARDPAAD